VEFERLADGRVKCPFDHHSPEYAGNHFAILDELRENGPLVWSDLHGGFWIATSHDLVRRLGVDGSAVSVAHGPDRKGGIAIPARPGTKTRPLFVPGEAEGEEHDNYRLALNPHFSRQRVLELQPMIQRHVDATIDRIAALGSFDVVGDFVAPILSGIACEHLGLEVEEPRKLFRSLALMVSYFGDGHGGSEFNAIADSFNSAWQTVVETVASRRANPCDDVISYLTQWDKPAFTDEQIQMMTLNVVLGSADTTSALLGQAIMYLYEHADVRDQLRSQPDLIRPAVEEFLRLFAVSMGAGRTMTRDVDVDGVTLKTGDRILLSYPAANHDPARYPEPYAFDLDRGSKRHLGMAVGPHFCLGAHLAKAISETALRAFLGRIDEFTVDVAGAETNADKNALNQWIRIPAVIG
jgi:cytochrome P450